MRSKNNLEHPFLPIAAGLTLLLQFIPHPSVLEVAQAISSPDWHINTEDTTNGYRPTESAAKWSTRTTEMVMNVLAEIGIQDPSLREIANGSATSWVDNSVYRYNPWSDGDVNLLRTYCATGGVAYWLAASFSTSDVDIQEIINEVRDRGYENGTFSAEAYLEMTDPEGEATLQLSENIALKLSSIFDATSEREISQETVLAYLEQISVGDSRLFFIQKTSTDGRLVNHIGHVLSITRVSDDEFVMMQTSPGWYVDAYQIGRDGGIFVTVDNAESTAELLVSITYDKNGGNVMFVGSDNSNYVRPDEERYSTFSPTMPSVR